LLKTRYTIETSSFFLEQHDGFCLSRFAVSDSAMLSMGNTLVEARSARGIAVFGGRISLSALKNSHHGWRTR